MDDGPGAGDYHGWITDGEQPWAAILPAGAMPAGRWVPYVMVDDLDAAAKQAVALGGTVLRDKTVGPGGTSVTVADPSGAIIALFTPRHRVRPRTAGRREATSGRPWPAVQARPTTSRRHRQKGRQRDR